MAQMARPLGPPAADPPSDPPSSPVAAGPRAEAPARAGSPAARFAFRFAAAYLVLYFFPAPITELEPMQPLAEGYARLWRPLVLGVGRLAFGVDLAAFPGESSDSHYAWVQIACFLALAALAAAVWTFLERGRAEVRGREWIRAYVRVVLAVEMIQYGAVKVIPSQFPPLTAEKLLQPIGEMSPMSLLWAFMGASRPYTVFTGAVELGAGLLLIPRRTALLGALLSLGALGNVVALDVAYDVHVKIWALHLLLAAAFVVAPDLGRLAGLFLRNRPVEPRPIRPLFARRRLHGGALALRAAFFAAIVALSLHGAYGVYHARFAEPKPPFYGLWEVDRFALDGVERPPLWTDPLRWRRAVFGFETLYLHLGDDSLRVYRLARDPARGSFRLTPMGPGKPTDPRTESLAYRQAAPGRLTLEGRWGGHAVRADLRRGREESSFPVNRGFRWIHEPGAGR